MSSNICWGLAVACERIWVCTKQNQQLHNLAAPTNKQTNKQTKANKKIKQANANKSKQLPRVRQAEAPQRPAKKQHEWQQWSHLCPHCAAMCSSEVV